jgi:hypothetical protein
MRQGTAIGLAIVLAYIGLGLIKSCLTHVGGFGEFAAGGFLTLVAVWMLVAVLRRGIIR